MTYPDRVSSPTNASSSETPPVSPDSVLEQLHRILTSPLFQGSERSTSLLRYLVQRAASGETARLKEYTVGTEALGKGASFDPRTDPVVRAEASRLRIRLEKYYATEGQADSVIITLPKGSYVPRFQTRSDSQDSAAGPGPLRALPGRLAWLASGIAIAVCVIVLIAWGVGRAPRPDTPVSIAVLPFSNMSSDAEQGFFSDGITEEITSALARIPGLIVIGRTSAFQFKGQNKDLRAIGQALSATHLIEGSVRKDGNEIRITAQLIKADDGSHLWTESYNRELRGLFALQEEIATAIAVALRVPLGLQQGDTLVSNRTGDLDSYQQYLRARALFRARSVASAVELLEQVVARDRSFAPAWGLLARAYGYGPFFGPEMRNGSLQDARRLMQSAYEKSEKAAREAIRLDSRSADGYQMLADIEADRGQVAAGEDLYKKALALDPNEPDVLHAYANALASAGRLKDSLSIREKLRTLEPFVPIYNIRTAELMQATRQDQASIPILEATEREAAGGLLRNVFLARAYAAEGRYAEAADTLLLIEGDLVSRQSVEDAARLLRRAPTTVNAPKALPVLEGELSFVYAYVGAPERALEWHERLVEVGYSTTSSIAGVWVPEFAALRKTERFKTFVRRAGLVDYWRERGWPDLCRPMGADDFVCD